MSNKKHPFDLAAERLEAIAAQPAAEQDASPDFCECEVEVDDQAQMVEPSSVVLSWGPSKGLGADGFPMIPIPAMRVKGKPPWTDVLSTDLPWREGYLLNEKALALFRRLELGEFREYPVTVQDRKGNAFLLTYVLIRNEIAPASFDFARSEFYLCDMVGVPKEPVAVESFEEWAAKIVLARKGELNGCEKFSRLAFKKLRFLSGSAPRVDHFTLGRLASTVYVSSRFKEALAASGIAGLEIRPNRRLFAGD